MEAKKGHMTDLEKFKRRLIRSVARLLIKERRPEDEVFEEMQKETGCKCRILWNRMRILTIKKLQRLLNADDKSDSIAAVGRMSLTDWLLFDLVIVHEEIDVIGKETILKSQKDLKPLLELFVLVQRFDIEQCEGDKLAEAWTAATILYNNMGHQCSPMLMQRRWYQLKQVTREQFYAYWYNYRGTASRLEEANKSRPTKLMRAIAKRFPYLILKTFVSWDEMIQKDLVIMPEVFEDKMRQQLLPKPIAENSPDVVVVEPEVETIVLGDESDSEPEDSQCDDENQIDEKIDSEIYIPGLLKQSTIKTEPYDISEGMCANTDTTTPIATQEESAIDIKPLNAIGSTGLTISSGNILANSMNNTIDIHCSNILEENSSEDNLKVEIYIPGLLKQSTIKTEPYDISEGMCANTDTTTPIATQEKSAIDIKPLNAIGSTGLTISSGNILANSINNTIDIHCSNILEENLSEDNLKVETRVYEESGENGTYFINEETKMVLPQITSVVGNVIMNEDLYVSSSSSSVLPTNIIENGDTDIIDLGKDAIPIDKSPHAVCNIKENQDCCLINDEEKASTPVKDIQKKIKPLLNIQYKKAMERALKAANEANNKENNLELEIADKVIADNNTVVSKPETHESEIDAAEIAGLDFVDDDVEFLDDGIEFVDDDKSNENEHDGLTLPISSAKSNYCKDNFDDSDNIDTGKFDLKLLMDPVVYTIQLENIPMLKNKAIDMVVGEDLINEINAASKIISPNYNIIDVKIEKHTEEEEIYDDIFRHDMTERTGEIIISDDKRVKLASHLFKKPRVRDYNYIQLCKNPDFNTRLKRLNVGFLTSSKNRTLLRECKPLTIDVSKAFEQKLINDTIYLKDIEVIPTTSSNCEYVTNNINVKSSVPSLIDGLVANMSSKDSLDKKLKEATERKTVINLPDINDVRRINQKLLTAEVSPLQVNDFCSKEISKFGCFENSEKNEFQVRKASEHNYEKNQKSQGNVESNKNETRYESNNDNKCYNSVVNTKNICPDNISDKQMKNKTTGSKTVNLTSCGPLNQQIKPAAAWLFRPSKVLSCPSSKEEALLTLDTFNKMFRAMEGETDTGKVYLNEAPCKKIIWKPTDRIKSKKKRTTVNNEKHKDIEETSDVNTTAVKPKINLKYGNTWYKTKKLKKQEENLETEKIDDGKIRKELVVNKVTSGHNTNPDVNLLINEDEALKGICVSNVDSRYMIENYNSHTFINKTIDAHDLNTEVNLEHNHNVEKNQICVIDSQKNGNNSEVDVNKIIDVPNPEVNLLDDQEINKNCITNSEPASVNLEQHVVERPISNESHNKSQNVNHLLNETENAPQALKAVCNRNTDTYTPEHENLQTPRNVINSPVFTVLPIQNTHLPESIIQCDQNKYFAKLNLHQMESCSCQLPIVNSSNKHLVLDGSSFCAIHRPLQTSHYKKTPEYVPDNRNLFQRMFFSSSLKLSKYKILLSTVTYPKTKRIKEPICNSSNVKSIVSTPLPPGVQLILSSSGELTYSVDPGIQLDYKQISEMQVIIDKVKLKLNITAAAESPSLVTNEVVDLTIDEGSDNNTLEKESTIIESFSEQRAQEKDKDGIRSLKSNAAINYNQDMCNNKVIDVDVTNDKISDEKLIDTFEIRNSKDSKQVEQIRTENFESSQIVPLTSYDFAKKIASDLQQQSDNKFNDKNLATYSEVAKDNPQNVSLQEKSDDFQKTTNKGVLGNTKSSILYDLMEISGIGEEDITPVNEEQTPTLSVPLGYKNPLVVNVDKENLRISPIMSFKELRYACENNAKFFELHCMTGVMQKINVCLSKSTKLIPSSSVPLKHRVLSKLKLPPAVVLKSPNLKHLRKTLLKSKVSLFEKNKPTVTLDITNDDDDDSSDDEPLIKKSKRMKELKEIEALASKNRDSNELNDSYECLDSMEDEVDRVISNTGNADSRNLVEEDTSAAKSGEQNNLVIEQMNNLEAGTDNNMEAGTENNMETVEENGEEYIDVPMEEFLDEDFTPNQCENGNSSDECILGI